MYEQFLRLHLFYLEIMPGIYICFDNRKTTNSSTLKISSHMLRSAPFEPCQSSILSSFLLAALVFLGEIIEFSLEILSYFEQLPQPLIVVAFQLD